MTENYNLKAPNKITGAKYNNVVIDYEQYMKNGITKVRPWTDENGDIYVLVRFGIDYVKP